MDRDRTRTALADRGAGPADSRSRRVGRLLARRPADLRSRAAGRTASGLAVAGAALLVWSAVIHLRLWADGYRDIAVVGPLFLVQGVGGIVLALVLAVFRRLVLLLAGAAALAGTAAGLLVSVYGGVFGYRESLAVPYAGQSLAVEFTGAAALAIAALLVVSAPKGRRPVSRRAPVGT